MLVVGLIVVILVVSGIIVTQKDNSTKDKSRADVLPEVELIPTVGPEVKVILKADAKKREATIQIAGIPNGTQSVEYELSYNALVEEESVPKGVIGTIEYDGEDPITRKITLGTCSSGTCKYDEGVSHIKVTLKFQGDYGSQLFEGEFDI